jgi:hypothetical protein
MIANGTNANHLIWLVQLVVILIICYYLNMKKLQPGDEVIKMDEELGIAWILLPPDASLGGFRGISPRVMDEEKFSVSKKKAEEKKG